MSNNQRVDHAWIRFLKNLRAAPLDSIFAIGSNDALDIFKVPGRILQEIREAEAKRKA